MHVQSLRSSNQVKTMAHTMKSPNIVLVMADQLAPQFTGAYGYPVVKTPAMDRLAERGCRFDAARRAHFMGPSASSGCREFVCTQPYRLDGAGGAQSIPCVIGAVERCTEAMSGMSRRVVYLDDATAQLVRLKSFDRQFDQPFDAGSDRGERLSERLAFDGVIAGDGGGVRQAPMR